MSPLRRHQLVWLDEFGWFRILARAHAAPLRDTRTLACLEHWAEQRWPLVVTRQAAAIHPLDADADGDAGTDAPLALGLPAPACWGRRRIAVEASTRAIVQLGEFAAASELTPSLPEALRADWSRLCAGLAALGQPARVYGSHGWQHLTGLDYVHDASDIDLIVPVATPAQADRAVALLQHSALAAPRLDGELLFPDGASVAWREWAQLRHGQTDRVLVKRLASATLEDVAQWQVAA